MFTRFFWNWLQLHTSQWLPKQELEKLQLKKLKKILSHSYEKVPFYRRFYDQHGVHPNDLESLEDIQRFPIITKELARDIPLKDRTATDVNLSQCEIRTSSGSTGIPVSILEDKNSLSYIDAYLLRRYVEHGYRFWGKICRTDTHPTKRIPELTDGEARPELSKALERVGRFKRIIVEEGIEKNLEMLMKEHPQILLAYPSYLRIAIEALRDRENTSFKPSVIMTYGEVLDESSRTLFNSVFGSQVYNGYGCIEVAPLGMAWECRKLSGLHINSDSVLLEVLKDGEPVSPGESGEVVATSFFRFSTPMIRYQVGDIATLTDDECTCGREMPLIKNIDGRVVDFIKIPDGRQISPFKIMSLIQSIPGVGRYQIVQETQNRIVATIEKGKEFDQTTTNRLRDAYTQLFSSDIQLEINTVERFPVKIGKKFRVVTSKV